MNQPPPDQQQPSTSSDKYSKLGDKIQGTGIVTVFEECLPKGVIDGTYFFEKSDVGPDIKKGSKVQFTAVRDENELQWNAVGVKLFRSPEEIEKENKKKYITIIGKVTNFEGGSACVKYGSSSESDIQIIPGEILPQDFKVRKGDYLQLKLYLNDLDDPDAGGIIHSVEPTNKKTLVGQVRNSNGRLSIENYIYFDSESCPLNTRMPRLNDCVCVEAIESDQGLYNWRAISIRPSNFHNYTALTNEAEGWLDQGSTWTGPLDDLLKNKNGIRIIPDKVIGFPGVMIGSSLTRSVEIQNNSDEIATLKNVIIKGDQSVCKFIFEKTQKDVKDEFMSLIPNRSGSIQITCIPEMMGSTRELAIFDFGIFCIGRYLTVTALTPLVNILDEMKLKDPTQVREWRSARSADAISKVIEDRNRPVVRAPQAVRAPFFLQKRMDSNSVPKSVWTIVQKEDEAELVKKYPGAVQELRIQNYQEKFRIALWLEEIQNDVLRRQYDIDGVALKPSGEHYRFDVPGIRDIHPPINIGDPISASFSSEALNIDPETKSTKYDGFVYDIYKDCIVAKFSEAFTAVFNGSKMNIQFKLGRTTYKRSHHAVQQAVRYLGEDWLFPSDKIECKPPRIPFIEDLGRPDNYTEGIQDSSISDDQNHDEEKGEGDTSSVKRIFHVRGSAGHSSRKALTGPGGNVGRRAVSMYGPFKSDTLGPSGELLTLNWCNQLLNKEQKDAVRRILRGQGRPLPYIVYGPPGTGKTVTIVEAIIQVYKLDKNSRTLVVAPSNSAADVIAEYLIASNQFSIGDFVRLVGFLRHENTIPETIRDYCHDGALLDTVARHRLIVCTCTTAGQFYQLGLDTGHFTHVFIDEAGYCTEPEALIAASLVALDKSGQVILAGDPKQLGPVLMSDAAVECGLSLSFLERLMNRPLYSRNEEQFPVEKYNPIVLTKLVKNYRAHATLLKLPSKLFYDDELEAAAAQDSVDLFHSLDFMRNYGTPLLFHGVQGKCSREIDSPSWYNKAEVIQVFEYVRMLREHGLTKDDIGIITPYRKQVEKIRTALELGLLIPQEEVPKVGSVEEFQGGERKVMILSLVRSEHGRQLERENLKDSLYFVFSPKRFNVAITRAKAILIVIGNPHVLIHDDIWMTFMKYCIELKCYTGCDLPDALTNPNAVRFSNTDHMMTGDQQVTKNTPFRRTDRHTYRNQASGFADPSAVQDEDENDWGDELD